MSEPTYNQIETLYRWFEWRMPTPKARAAMQFLKANATRAEVSSEIKRVGDLWHSRKLDEELCFSSPIWEKFKYKAEEEPKTIVGRLVVDNG